MRKPVKKEAFINQPQYQGGDQAISDFISKNLVFPAIAIEKGIEGTVQVKYEVDDDGNVIDTKIVAGLDSSCDKEARRVVSLLKFRVPKNPNGLKLIFHKELFIHFKIPKKTLVPTPPPTESDTHIPISLMNYQIVFTPTVAKKTEQKSIPIKKSYPIIL